MNVCFYEAIARLPLGTVSAIEFLPVILLAAVGLRSARNCAALGLAAAGVYVLTRVQLRGVWLGFGLAFANAACFALYIVLAHRISRAAAHARHRRPGRRDADRRAGHHAIGGPVVAPHLLDPVAVAAGIGVGISSSVIPYVCDQLAMARLRRETYSLMVSLLPATATVMGIVVLARFQQRASSSVCVWSWPRWRPTTTWLQRAPHPDLVEVGEQVARVFVDPVRARVDELLAPVAARQQTDPERPRAPRREQIPDAVADHDAVADVDADPLGGGQEQVGVGLGVADLVAGHERRVGRQTEQLERRAARSARRRWWRSPTGRRARSASRAARCAPGSGGTLS